MATKLSAVFNDQTLTSSNVLASGYQLFTYAAGSTTKLTTYTDSTGATPQTNPIILNSLGYPTNGPIWLTSGLSYKFVLASPTDTDPPASPIKTIDNISGINDTSTTISQWVASALTPTYVSATSFTLAGDQTSEFHAGRRLQLTTSLSGSIYGTIITSVYGALTTVTVLMDSTAIDATLTVVNLSILRNDNAALPYCAFPNTGRNRFINGGMGIDQRNLGSAQTIIAAAALAYTVDRWYGYCTGANVTGQQVAGTAPNQYNYRFTGAASVTKIGFSQRIEAANSQDIAGRTASISIDLANSLLSTVTWTAWRANTNDTFGTLGAPTRTQIGTGTFAVTSTLTRYEAQLAVPSAATTGIEIEFSVGAQISGTWTIGRAQIEAGSFATPFDQRFRSTEQQLCEAYCQWVPYDYAGSYAGSVQIDWNVPFRTKMRATPSYSALTADPERTQAQVNVTTNAFTAASSIGGLAYIVSTGAGAFSTTGYRSLFAAEL